MTSCHLVADRDLSLLCNIDANCLIDARRQLIAILSGKYLGIDNNPVCAVRNLQGSITDFSGLLTEDSPQQTLLSGQLRLTLRSHPTY